MKKFIQLRGCMASGKTTTARSIISQGDYKVCYINIGKKGYPYTYDADKNWIITGRYDGAVCGGLDGKITDTRLMKYYLHKLMHDIHPDVIVFEAVMYGSTFKFSYELSKICKQDGYDYTAILLAPPFEKLLSNLYIRNGGKPINVKVLSDKYFNGFAIYDKLKRAGVDICMENPMEYKPDNAYQIVTRHL